MATEFDPYHKWLAIPPDEQPPNHYRLLALPMYETDREVVANAADQRMMLIRSFQAGPHGALSQQLLNQIAAAKVCLLDAARKEKYDAELRGKANIAIAQRPRPPRPGDRGSLPEANVATARRRPATAAGPSLLLRRPGIIAALAGAAALLMLAGLYAFSGSPSTGHSDPRVPPQAVTSTASGSVKPGKSPDPADGHSTSTPPPGRDLSPLHMAEIQPQRIQVGEKLVVNLALAAEDAGVSNVHYTMAPHTPPDVTIDPATGAVRWMTTKDQIPGHFSLDVVAVSGDRRGTVSIPVDITPSTPAIRTKRLEDQLVEVGQTLKVPLFGDRPANSAEKMTWRLVAGPTGAALAEDEREFVWTPGSTEAGQSFEVAVQAVDSVGHGVQKVFSIHVAQVPAMQPAEKPVLTALPAAEGTQAEGHGINVAKRSQIMDDAAAKFVGAWKSFSLAGAYNNNFRFLTSTGGGSTATYEFTGLAPGSYRVMATWHPPLANRSNDVPFVISSGASTTTVKVNQRNAPAENAKIDGSVFQALATIGVSGGTLTVTIHEGSNSSGYAIADAVRIEMVTKGPRAPAPSAEEQAAATKRVRQLFAEKIASARANRAERLKLSEQLLALAEQTDDDASGRFALYQEAADQALAAGAVGAYIRAMEALGQQYVVDTTEQMQPGLLELAKSAHGADAAAEVTRGLMAAIDEALLAEKWENAQAMSRAASTLAAKSGDPDLRKRVLQQSREIAGMKAFGKETERAKAKLEQEPDDPESNRAVGIHQALILGEWDKALPLLAKGDDARLAAAAKAELAAASEKGEWADAADKWWTVTKGDSSSANLKKLYSTKSTAKEGLRRHVAEVHAKALPKATGLNKRLIEQHLEELQPAEAPAAKKAAVGLAETLARKRWTVTWSDGAVYRNVTFKSDGTWSAVAAPRIQLAGRWKTDGEVVVATYGNYVDKFRSVAGGILAESQSGANRQSHRTGQVRAE